MGRRVLLFTFPLGNKIGRTANRRNWPSVCVANKLKWRKKTDFFYFCFIAESRFSCCAMTSLILVAKINLVVFASTASTMTKDTGLCGWLGESKKKKRERGYEAQSRLDHVQ